MFAIWCILIFYDNIGFLIFSIYWNIMRLSFKQLIFVNLNRWEKSWQVSTNWFLILHYLRPNSNRFITCHWSPISVWQCRKNFFNRRNTFLESTNFGSIARCSTQIYFLPNISLRFIFSLISRMIIPSRLISW